jgi:UDP:flavonoid glycosyltransferase YjiC (YdhE family)
VAGGVRRVLDDLRYRGAAGRVKAEMAQHDAGNEGADLLEELAHTRATVPRLDGDAQENAVSRLSPQH